MKRMKLVFLMMTGLLLSLEGCKKLDEFTQFDLTYHSQATIPATVSLNIPFDIPLPPVTTNSEEEFENNNTHKDLLESIKLKELELKITDPVDGDFGFLSDIEIYISTDNQPEKLLAWKHDIPDSAGNTLSLETTSDELKNYLTEESFNLRVKVTVDQLITQDYELDIKTVFHVNAKILGV